jgi:3-oxoacyl-[acyl-carrier protein] reductase
VCKPTTRYHQLFDECSALTKDPDIAASALVIAPVARVRRWSSRGGSKEARAPVLSSRCCDPHVEPISFKQEPTGRVAVAVFAETAAFGELWRCGEVTDVDLKLDGKRALVTGSTAGIGAAIARSLVGEGAAVVVHGRDENRGNQMLEALGSHGGHVAFVKANLSEPRDVHRLADEARRTLGGIDILVNNAAVYPQHTWFEGGADIWPRIFEVNVMATVRLIQLLVPDMIAAGWGRVIQISSGEGSKPFAHMPGYAATKAATNNLTVSLCQAVSGSGVTVNAIAAGLIRTSEVEQWFLAEAKARGWKDDWNDIEAQILKNYLSIPVGHLGTPDEVARVAAFLASPHASYINGAIVRVDGGSHVWSA